MKKSVIAIRSCVITTIIVYALLALYFFKWMMLLEEKPTLLWMIKITKEIKNDDL